MTAAFAANTPRHIRGIGAVLAVMPSGRSQCGLKRRRPLFVCLGEPPDLVRRQAKITQYLPERLAAVDRIQELLAPLGRESLLRVAPEAGPCGDVLRLTASMAVTPFQPAGQRAVCRLGATPAAVGISLISDLT
jgi:hypothetical protein